MTRMKKLLAVLAPIALTVWVGGLLATGYLAVPVLFHAQPDRQLAGLLAGEIFSAMAYVGLVCAAILLWHTSCANVAVTGEKNKTRGIIAAMLIIGLVSQFGLSPVMAELKRQALPLEVMHSAFAHQFAMLHGVSSLLYLIESVLGLYLVARNRI